MKLTNRSLATAAMMALLLSACAERNQNSDPANAEPATDKWLGQWHGPEGTLLRLSGGKGKYQIVIQNLDGPQNYQGSAVGDRIQFERNGVKESIRATNGTGTEMKWLADKANCLTVRPGEGYCRD